MTKYGAHVPGVPEQSQIVYEAIERLNRNGGFKHDLELAAAGTEKIAALIRATWDETTKRKRREGRSLEELNEFFKSISSGQAFSWDTEGRARRKERAG
jgi:hypothetical protein